MITYKATGDRYTYAATNKEFIENNFDSPFFQDHDFVLIENNTTGEALAVDPTVHDYLRIDDVRYE